MGKPNNKKELQSFLGLVHYYRRFIRNCSKKSKPLTELTKNVPFNWTDSVNRAFKKLKMAIITAPVLTQFQPDRKIFVTTYACKYAIVAVLEREFDDGRYTVAFISRTLNPHEQTYAAHDLELLGIVDTIRAWQCYLYGQKFTVHTDHHPLKYPRTQEFLTSRQVRWLERISAFDFDIVPIKGKSSQVADLLSRQTSRTNRTNEYSKELQNTVIKKTSFIGEISTLLPGSRVTQTLLDEYQSDPFFKEQLQTPKNHTKSEKDCCFMGQVYVYPMVQNGPSYYMTTIQHLAQDM